MENTKSTYQQQYNKIVKAYMENRLLPRMPCSCFVGNMLDGDSFWSIFRNFSINNLDLISPFFHYDALRFKNYTIGEICKLEKCFLITLCNGNNISSVYGSTIDEFKSYKDIIISMELYEERLYLAMEKTLLLLREIHESNGEVINDYTFKKRHLQEEVQ